MFLIACVLHLSAPERNFQPVPLAHDRLVNLPLKLPQINPLSKIYPRINLAVIIIKDISGMDEQTFAIGIVVTIVIVMTSLGLLITLTGESSGGKNDLQSYTEIAHQ